MSHAVHATKSLPVCGSKSETYHDISPIIASMNPGLLEAGFYSKLAQAEDCGVKFSIGAVWSRSCGFWTLGSLLAGPTSSRAEQAKGAPGAIRAKAIKLLEIECSNAY